jgi:hypothetical protein
MIERKIEDVFGEEQLGLRRRKGNRSTAGMLRIISDRTLDTGE